MLGCGRDGEDEVLPLDRGRWSELRSIQHGHESHGASADTGQLMDSS